MKDDRLEKIMLIIDKINEEQDSHIYCNIENNKSDFIISANMYEILDRGAFILTNLFKDLDVSYMPPSFTIGNVETKEQRLYWHFKLNDI